MCIIYVLTIIFSCYLLVTEHFLFLFLPFGVTQVLITFRPTSGLILSWFCLAGKPSNDPNDVDYIPSIFKMNKPRTEQLKSIPRNRSSRKRSLEQRAAADFTDDEREAALGLCLLQDTPKETTFQPHKKPNRALKVVQLNNLVNSLSNEKLC